MRFRFRFQVALSYLGQLLAIPTAIPIDRRVAISMAIPTGPSGLSQFRSYEGTPMAMPIAIPMAMPWLFLRLLRWLFLSIKNH